MHPIERLRYVARSRGADAEPLVIETAAALRDLGLEPSGLVVACRRIVERHPACGPLWWLCSRALTAPEPGRALRACVEEMRADDTAGRLAATLPDEAAVLVVGWPDVTADVLIGRGDLRVLVVDDDRLAARFVERLERLDADCRLVPMAAAALAVAGVDLVLVEALALDAESALVPIGTGVAVAAAALRGVPVHLVAGRGRRLPATTMAAVIERTTCRDVEDADVETIPLSAVATVHGPTGPLPASRIVPDCEPAPELLRTSPM